MLTKFKTVSVFESILLAQIKSPLLMLYFAIKIFGTKTPFIFGVVIIKSLVEGSKSILPLVSPDKINSLFEFI
jgi:hypothetical protein